MYIEETLFDYKDTCLKGLQRYFFDITLKVPLWIYRAGSKFDEACLIDNVLHLKTADKTELIPVKLASDKHCYFGIDSISNDISLVSEPQWKAEFMVCYEDETWGIEGYAYISKNVPSEEVNRVAVLYWENKISQQKYVSSPLAVYLYCLEQISEFTEEF